MSDTAPAPAGWYADPDSPGILRWWDGQAWSERRAPAPPAAPIRVDSGDVASGVVGGTLLLFVGVLVVVALFGVGYILFGS